MYIRTARIVFFGLMIVLASLSGTQARADSGIIIPTREEAEKVNENKVGVVFTHEELFHQLVHNMEDELEKNSGLRIVPIMGKNHVQSVYDLLYLQGIDLALVRADAIEYVNREGNYPAVKRIVQSVAKVSEEKIVIIARKDYETIQDLDGQVVSFGLPGSGEYVTGTVAFGALDIEPDAIEVNNTTAIAKMKTGELAAMIYLLRAPDAVQTGDDLKAANAVKNLQLGEELHIIEIPETDELSGIYTPSTLTSADLPNVIEDGVTIPTYSVDAILAVYRWKPSTFRYEQTQRFVNAFVGGLAGLQSDAYDPHWKRVDLGQQTRNVAVSPMVDGALSTLAAEKTRLAEQNKKDQEQAVLAAKEAKIAELIKKTDELTARFESELDQGDAEELERMINELDSILE